MSVGPNVPFTPDPPPEPDGGQSHNEKGADHEVEKGVHQASIGCFIGWKVIEAGHDGVGIFIGEQT